MQRADIYFALFWVVVSVALIFEAAKQPIGWGDIGPEAGFIPFYLGIGMGICSVIILAQALWKRYRNLSAEKLIPPGALGSILKVGVSAALTVLATYWLGLYLAGAIYIALYMWRVGTHRWRVTIPVALGFPVLVFLFFEKLMLMPLPKGILEDFLNYFL